RKLLGSVESFKREGLGIWDERQQGRRAFGPGLWAGRRGEAPSGGVKCFGVKFTPDGSHVALAGAVRGRDGAVHVEAIRQAPMSEGTQWLVDYLVERKAGFALVAVDGVLVRAIWLTLCGVRVWASCRFLLRRLIRLLRLIRCWIVRSLRVR